MTNEKKTPAVTPGMRMSDVLRAHPQAAYALMGCGMGCVHCPSAQSETLEEAAIVHGIDVRDVCQFVNDWIEQHPSA